MKSSLKSQIAFRYREKDSLNGVTRETARRLASRLGLDETQTIHKALSELSNRILPKYAEDNGDLTNEQIVQINEHSPNVKGLKVKSSLLSIVDNDS